MNNNEVEIMERRFSSHGGSMEYTMDELRTQLDDMDKELRQAATYGLLLVAKNEELVVAMERMQVAQEGAIAELKGEIQTLERHREALQSDRDGWKLKCHEFEDEIFQLQQLPTQSCTCSEEPRMYELRRHWITLYDVMPALHRLLQTWICCGVSSKARTFSYIMLSSERKTRTSTFAVSNRQSETHLTSSTK
ncbi:hypothetical protein AC1031_006562 [Aphanomyces cochlioides]|nr:hypothetical protein AC1031_006562 [Aphanomyces cochlioides]